MISPVLIGNHPNGKEVDDLQPGDQAHASAETKQTSKSTLQKVNKIVTFCDKHKYSRHCPL